MAFSDLNQLVTDASEINSLIVALAQTIEDNGGDINHLNQLLDDAKGDRVLLTQLARRAIGPIWDLAENPFSLPAIDFKKPLRKFLEELNGAQADIHENVSSCPWSEPLPSFRCQYVLKHVPRRLSLEDILALDWPHAGVRELAVFANTMQPEQLSRCVVIAAGSRTDGPGKGPFASASAGFGKISLGWRGFKRPESQRLDMRNFYLVRV